MEPIALASAAIAALTPYLAKAGEGAAKKIGEEAAAAGEEAVRLYRALAAARPDAFTSDLAMSLSVLTDVPGFCILPAMVSASSAQFNPRNG